MAASLRLPLTRAARKKTSNPQHSYGKNIPGYYAAMSDSNAPVDGVAYDSCGA